MFHVACCLLFGSISYYHHVWGTEFTGLENDGSQRLQTVSRFIMIDVILYTNMQTLLIMLNIDKLIIFVFCFFLCLPFCIRWGTLCM